jgi:Protein of unknown function (DUF1236)
MSNRFLVSVAAVALIAGTGFANAQGTMGKEAPSGGAPAEHSAPSTERAPAAAPAAKPMAPSGMKATQSEPKQSEPNAPGGMKSQRTEENMGQKPNTTRSETNEPKGGKDMKAEGNGTKPEGREGTTNTEPKRAEEGKSQTTGQAGAGAKLSSEQRTRITTVIREQHVAPVTHVNFSISVGTRVPRDVSFHPLPAEIVTIYPEWRGYEFILVNNQILVVDPRTFEIVAVLDV